MVRRTKSEAAQTRNALLDAAEALFLERGVSQTMLQDIAVAAGTTRGAIYWHFQNKADLFNAMMERVTLPLERAFSDVADGSETDADAILVQLMGAFMQALRATAHDAHIGRVLEIATHKVEYGIEMQLVVRRRKAAIDQLRQNIEVVLIRASDLQGRTLPIPARHAALGLSMLLDGLLSNWLIDRSAFNLMAVGQSTLHSFLTGLGFSVPCTSGVIQG